MYFRQVCKTDINYLKSENVFRILDYFILRRRCKILILKLQSRWKAIHNYPLSLQTNFESQPLFFQNLGKSFPPNAN